MKRILGVVGLCALTGCYWTPTNGSNQESTSSVNLSGFSLYPNDVITLSATNLTTNSSGVIGHATASGTGVTSIPDDGYPLYPWSATLNLPADYWAPQLLGGLSTSLGRLLISGTTSSGYQVYSFNPSQESCVAANLSLDPIQAAEKCGAAATLAIFDNNGVSTSASSAPLVQLWTGSYTLGATTADWEIDSYLVNDGPGSRTVYAYLCHPSGTGPFPVQIYNHPGYFGLYGTLGAGGAPGPDDLGNCITGALNGWVTAMSAYRGEALNGEYAMAGTPTQIEGCLGEATDVLRLTTLVQAKSYANSEHTLMWGYSHGGCVTDRAVEEGAPVQAAATFAAMTDLGAMNAECNDYGCGEPYYPLPNPDGYTWSSTPMAYNWRSPAYFAGDFYARSPLPFLMIQGVDFFTFPGGGIYADGVLQTGAACELAAELSPAPTNVYMSSAGAVLGTVPEDCTDYPTLTWSNVNPASWTSWPTSTLLEFDDVLHINIVQTEAPWRLFIQWTMSLGWGSPYTAGYHFSTPAPIVSM